MQADLIATLIFIVLMAAFLIIRRSHVRIEWLIKSKDGKADGFLWVLQRTIFLLRYDTKIGITLMQKMGKALDKKWFKYIQNTIIVLSVVGIIFLIGSLIYTLVTQLLTPESIPYGGIALVLPFKTKSQFYIPFVYWIISIIIMASIHELAHGVIASAYKLKIEYTGFAFLCVLGIPLIPAAFVDFKQDEMNKRSETQQMAISGAGPLANIFLGLLIILPLLWMTPLVGQYFEKDGIQLQTINDGGWADKAGMKEGEIITFITTEYHYMFINDQTDLAVALDMFKDQDIMVRTDQGEYTGYSEGVLGVYVQEHVSIKDNLKWPLAAKWLLGLLFYVYFINLAVGLTNFLPVGFVDGGWITRGLCNKYLSKRWASYCINLLGYGSLALIIILIIMK